MRRPRDAGAVDPAGAHMKKAALLSAALAGVSLAALSLAQERTGAVRLSVVPESADWTYALGAPARFQATVARDGHALAGTAVRVACGPEQMPPTVEKAV